MKCGAVIVLAHDETEYRHTCKYDVHAEGENHRCDRCFLTWWAGSTVTFDRDSISCALCKVKVE